MSELADRLLSRPSKRGASASPTKAKGPIFGLARRSASASVSGSPKKAAAAGLTKGTAAGGSVAILAAGIGLAVLLALLVYKIRKMEMTNRLHEEELSMMRGAQDNLLASTATDLSQVHRRIEAAEGILMDLYNTLESAEPRYGGEPCYGDICDLELNNNSGAAPFCCDPAQWPKPPQQVETPPKTAAAAAEKKPASPAAAPKAPVTASPVKAPTAAQAKAASPAQMAEQMLRQMMEQPVFVVSSFDAPPQAQSKGAKSSGGAKLEEIADEPEEEEAEEEDGEEEEEDEEEEES